MRNVLYVHSMNMKAYATQNWKVAVRRFLFSYHSTAHTTTRRTPSELLIGRTIRTRWDSSHHSCNDKIVQIQAKVKQDQSDTVRAF